MSAAMEYHTQDFATQVAKAHQAVYSVAEASLELGKAQERERIIALLEARLDYHWEVGIIDNDTDDIYDLDDIIALIKGENA